MMRCDRLRSSCSLTQAEEIAVEPSRSTLVFGGREVQPAGWVFDAVAGEVEQEQVVAVAIGEEVLDPLADHRRALVHDRVDIEAADRRVAQHPGQRVDVLDRRPQPAQLRVVVGGCRDQQRGLTARHRCRPARCAGRSRSG